MTAHDPSLARQSGGLLGWLGFGSRQTGDASTGGDPASAIADRRDSLRQRQLDEIGRFLALHGLAVNGFTLGIAWNFLSRSDSSLVRAIDRQAQSRTPVTQEWLESNFGQEAQADELAMLTDLMNRLEQNIDEFGKTSKDAHTATSEYHSALVGHVSELEHVTRAGDVISDLASIAKVMLRRTRDIEKQMLRSEAQTRALKRRLDEARRTAEEDHLTGLPNRRSFEAVFETEFRSAREAADVLCVAFCDIDHFKRINDEHGHESGDRVLKLVAESLSHISNERCHVARHGGEEFVMLFRGGTIDEARQKLDNLREQLAGRHLVNRVNDKPFGKVSFSAGIADVFACGDPRSALRAADSALYRAKQNGRNRVELANEQDRAPAGAEAMA